MIRNACVNDDTIGSGQEIRNVAALEDYFAGSGLTCQRYEAAPGRASLVARIEGRDRTRPDAPPHGAHRRRAGQPGGLAPDPFAGDLVDGIVWGRGATDMLNLTATMAVATRRLAVAGFRPRGTLIYLAVADEEAGGALRRAAPHARTRSTTSAPTTSSPRAAACRSRRRPAPGSRSPWARRASTGAGSRSRGTPGHGSRPFRSDNALVTAAEVVRRIAAYQPKARILDVWRRYVEAVQPDRELAAGADRPRARARHRPAHGEPRPRSDGPRLDAHHVLAEPRPRRQQGEHGAGPHRDRRRHPRPARRHAGRGGRDARHGHRRPPRAASPSSPSAARRARSRRPDTPLIDTLRRVTQALVPGSHIVPRLTVGATDARFFRLQGIPAYGFGLHSPRIPHSEYPLMFHGNDERVDVESLRLSAEMWEALCREFLG